MKIIAFTGLKRSGKTTLANLIIKQLKETHGLEHVYHINFADAIKRQVALACDVDVKTVEDNKEVFRVALQWWGTEFRRQFMKDDDYWVKRWLNSVNFKPRNSIILCSDVRFDNEARAIDYVGGSVIEVFNPAMPRSTDKHPSEAGIDANLIDESINNDHTAGLSQLQLTAARLIKDYNLIN